MYFVTFIARNLTRRPIRTALTVLGLAVAIGSMVALLGIAHNIERAIAESFERRGIDLVVIAGGVPDQLSSELDESLVDRMRQVPGVEGAAGALIELTELRRGTASINALVHGWAADDFVYEDLHILDGRRLLPGDRGKVMLGTTLARNLGRGVGDTVELQGEPFEVVGVFQSFSVFENGSVGILLEELQRLSARPGKVTGFSVRVDKSLGDPAAAVEEVRRRIEALTDDEGRPVRLSAQPTRDYVASASHVQLVRAVAWMVSSIAILIGVISMLNTMVMSVVERTREIGILRAIGWPPGRVIRMVLGESMLLGLAAVAVGTVGAVAVTHLLAQAPQVSGFIEGGVAPAVVARGVLITALIGLVGGAYPALRAARLLPTEAIRHD
jgi:putative ABC transport system permease protein